MATIREAIERARKALIDGQADAALEPCQEVLARYPKHLEATCLLAEARREMRQLPQAADLFERVIAADPESLIGHWGLATILEERSDPEGALYELQCAWDVSPGQPAVAEEVARLRDALGWEARPVDFSEGGLARVYWRGHQYRRALTEARRALARSPERLDLMVLECECLWRLGRVGEAAEVALDILAESPDCLKANLIRGYARLEAGPRTADEARKLLSKARSMDPESIVASGLFPDRELPGPLVAGEVDLDREAPEMAPMVFEQPVVDVVVETVVEVQPELEPVLEVEAELQTGVEPEPEVPVDVEPEPVAVPEPEAPVPTWLTKSETAPAGTLPGGLDPTLYSEWADLLGEEVELDADSVSRLEAALAEATGAGDASGAWREVVLDGQALAEVARQDEDAAPKPAKRTRRPVAVEQPTSAPDDLPSALERARTATAAGDEEGGAAAYRDILRTYPDSARDLVEELCGRVDASPEHVGMRRALGDAYMRSGRFQKAIEEYNRAAACSVEPVPAAVA